METVRPTEDRTDSSLTMPMPGRLPMPGDASEETSLGFSMGFRGSTRTCSSALWGKMHLTMFTRCVFSLFYVLGSGS